MSTSKLPARWVNLPDEIIDLFARIPGVYANLRPNQWQFARNWIGSDEDFVYPTVRNFLKNIASPAKVAILFQGFGLEVGTAVVELPKITCAESGYPCLNIEQPEIMRRIHGNHFWGAFILAIAKVPQETEIFATKDPNFQKFIQLVKKLARP